VDWKNSKVKILAAQKTYGIVLAVVIMLVAKFLAAYIPNLGVTILALMLGIIVRQLIPNFSKFTPGVVWSEKYVLETAIVFIGFGFEINKFSKIGTSTILMITVSIIVVILISLLLGKIFGSNNNKLYWLLGAGSAICGSSAIGATAPLIEAKEEETGLSLAVVNVLGLIGMILLPLIAAAFQFSSVDTGIFLGGILQSVGHVVSAGFAVSDEVGQFSTVVKMGRVAFLIPFLLIIFFLFRKRSNGTKIKLPLFILFFLIAVLISQLNIFNANAIKQITKLGDGLLNIGMAAIGLKINIKSLWKISGKAFFAGGIIFIFQIILYFLFITVKL